MFACEEPYHGGGNSPFDQVKHLDEHGNEYWTGRELMPLMEYRHWEDFRRITERAYQSAKNSGRDADQHFSAITEKGTGGRPRSDYRLTRFAAYLVAMNGDPNKPAVASAQAYFAIRTREAEVRPQLSGGLAVLEKVLYEIHDTQVRVGAVELVQQRQDQRHTQLEARVSTLEGNHGYVSALGYAKTHPPLCTEQVYLSRVGKVATRMAKQQGIRVGQVNHPNFGKANTYPEHILKAAFEEVNAKQ